MPRRSKWEKFKPEVWRLLSEGFVPMQVIQQFHDRGDKIPKSTVYDWEKEYKSVGGFNAERYSGINPDEIPRRLPIDPESPIENLINRLWDLYDEADTAPPQVVTAKTKILETVFKLRQYQFSVAVNDDDNADECPDLYVEVTAPNEATAA